MARFGSSFVSRILPWIVIAHVLIFVAFWQTNSLFYASTNDYLADMLGRRMDYVSLLLWVSGVIAAWSCVRLLLQRLAKTHRLARLSAWLYGLVALVYIAFFYGSFRLLFQESPVQWVRIGQMIQYYRLVLDGILLIGLGLLAVPAVRSVLRKSGEAGASRNWRPAALVLLAFGLLWSLPLFFPPGSVLRDPLPDKPMIVAHRGASMLAPENTLAAAHLAAGLGVYGLETDIHLSRDGELFLLHDETFDRTTDIKKVFPGREDEPAEGFSLAEISQLNAGGWFLDQDPFGALKRNEITPEQVQAYSQQGVPLLADWLAILQDSGQAFIFDLKPPPQGNPYAETYFELALNQIHQAGIDPQVWFLVDENQLGRLRQQAPEMKAAYGAAYQSPPEAASLKAQGYQIVNVEYGISPRQIQSYQAAGLWVNLYTVDEPWQFSRLWLLGVDSITTSNAGVMASLTLPALALPYNLYVLVWTALGLLGLGLIAWLISPAVRPRKSAVPAPLEGDESMKALEG